MKGHIWMIRNYGLRAWWRYEKARREGMTINYAEIFTPDELQKLEDAGLAMWPIKKP